MLPEERDAALLWDMLTYAREIVDTAGAINFERYMQDKTLRLATERRLEIIGEAARGVTRAFQEAHPEIPWRKIIAQRHVLAHEYGEIRQETIFRVVTDHIPHLVEQLVRFVPSADHPDDVS